MQAIVFRQINQSEDFSESNRLKMTGISIEINNLPKTNDIIEQIIMTVVKHYLVIRIENDVDMIAVFVKEIACAIEEKEKQQEIIL